MTEGLTLRQGGWRYLVPNGLTATNLTFGTLSCFYSIYGDTYLAGWFVLLAVCFDRFDGAAARALRATGRFGVEFDSLADLVSFGVAPAMVILADLVSHPGFPYASGGLHRTLLFAACGFYVLAAAFRLARFNVFAQTSGTDVYFGLPSPAGAATVVAGYLVLLKYSGDPAVYPGWEGDLRLFGGAVIDQALREYYPVLVALVAALMVFGLKVPKFRAGRNPTAIYIVLNMVLVYLCVFLRVFPEFLLFVAIQVIIISTTYHYFWESAREVSKQPLFEALSADGSETSATAGEQQSERAEQERPERSA
jgi:CDP-diacylglycerol--serine O-phosphatidyltransferase